MCKLAHVIRYTCILYYNKIIIFAVSERWLICDYKTDCSFVYLIFAAILHKLNKPTIADCYSISHSWQMICIALPTFIQIEARYIDFWRCRHGVVSLQPVAVLVTTFIHEGQYQFPYQISTRYFNPRLSYHYFRFRKANGCHIVFQFRFWPIHRHFHLILHYHTNFLPNQIKPDGAMTSYRFFKMAAMALQIYFRLQI